MRATPGFRGADVLRRVEHHEVAFITLTRFDAVNAIRAFAGDDYETPFSSDRRSRSSRATSSERLAAIRQGSRPDRHVAIASRSRRPAFPFARDCERL
jgi:hypothetical protein